MEKKQYHQKRTGKQIQKWRGYFLLPLFILPFLTLLFWTLGGGKGSTNEKEISAGFNVQWPVSTAKEKNQEDKLSFYETARKDSLKWKELMRGDPYYKKQEDTLAGNKGRTEISNSPSNDYLTQKPDTVDQQMQQQLKALQKLLHPAPHNKTRTEGGGMHNWENRPATEYPPSLAQDKDSELLELNHMMDKIIRIQHPEASSNVPLVSTGNTAIYSTQPWTPRNTRLNDSSPKEGFFGMSLFKKSELLKLALLQSTRMEDGAALSLILLDEGYIEEAHLPVGTRLNAHLSIQGDRMRITVTSIRLNEKLIPVHIPLCNEEGAEEFLLPKIVVKKRWLQKTLDHTSELSSLDPSINNPAAQTAVDLLRQQLKPTGRTSLPEFKKGSIFYLKTQN